MTPLPLASPVTVGEIVAGKYRVESVLGTGAMGVVVGARHIALEHTVAIKLLLHHLYGSREESIARFLTEARAAARIDSDHVARVFDVGTLPDGTPYMVMEHLEGWDLETELERRGPLPIFDAVDFILQAADAIAAASQLGIVHRDLKPANLFLATRADGVRRLKVLDFGISKVTNDPRAHRVKEDGSFGTPAYMSPEAVRDPANVDTRTDVWALGAILYELVTGQLPFAAPTVNAVLEMVLEQDPCPMSVLRRDVPPELEAIVMGCLARDRNARFPDATALTHALLPFGPGGSISMMPVGASSMEPMIASVPMSSARALGGRETVRTEPDPAEVHGAEAFVRKRTSREAMLILSSAVLVLATFALLSWLSMPRRRPTVSAAPPPPVASVAPPIVGTPSVQSAYNHVQSAPLSSAPAIRSVRPRSGPKR